GRWRRRNQSTPAPPDPVSPSAYRRRSSCPAACRAGRATTTGAAPTRSAGGLLLAASRDLPADRADQLAAITSGVVSLTDGASRMFSAGTVQQTIIEMDSGYLFLMSISDGSSMAVLAARSCDVGQVGYEMALLVERVGQALVPLPRDAVRS